MDWCHNFVVPLSLWRQISLKVIKKLSKSDKLRFLNISEGSLAECQNYIILSRDLGYVEDSLYKNLFYSLEEISRLLTSYSKGIINHNGIQD